MCSSRMKVAKSGLRAVQAPQAENVEAILEIELGVAMWARGSMAECDFIRALRICSRTVGRFGAAPNTWLGTAKIAQARRRTGDNDPKRRMRVDMATSDSATGGNVTPGSSARHYN